jgi:outer membrane autotransporter protein
MARAAGLAVLTLPQLAKPAAITVPSIPIPIPGSVPDTTNVSSLNNTLQQVCGQLQVTAVLTAAQTDLARTCSFLADPAAPPGALAAAYTALLGQQINALDPQIKLLDSRSDGLYERLAALRQGTQDTDAGTNVAGGGASADATTLLDGKLGLFASGKITSARKTYTTNSFSYGIHDSVVTVGTDYRFMDSLVAGLAYTGSSTNVPFSYNLGSMKLQENGINLYTSLYKGGFYLDVLGGYGISRLDSTRNVSFSNTTSSTTVDQQAFGHSHVRHVWAGLSLGDELAWRNFTLTPEGSLTFHQARLDAYTESMSQPSAPGGGLALSYGATTVPSLQARAGLAAALTVSTPWGVLQPRLHGAYVRELRNTATTYTTSFASAAGLGAASPILLQGDAPASRFFENGAGLNATFGHGLSAFFDYEQLSSAKYVSSHTLFLGVRYQPGL